DLQIREDGRPDAATSTMTLLDNSVPEDQAMTELVEQCNAELARRNREGGLEALGVVISPPQAGTNTHMGDKRCQHCHTEIYATWMKSDHSRAYKSLVDSRRESNPDCLRCHVLALGSADGFRGINLSPDLINVQCESCHGRAGDHVRAREEGLAETFGRMQRVSQDSCQVCHEGIHSPKFSYDSYWERIKHGE
ncbi:MAG: cytochrome c family protein, partial [Planctomycetia bacterium]|nr:cytochrome c family protein [Planctomycetia bacterium]